MDDLISRQAAIDALIKWWYGYEPPDIGAFENIIEKLPSVQPEIIRCKDCKYCDTGIDEDGNYFLKCLGWGYGFTKENDYCSHGEWKDE